MKHSLRLSAVAVLAVAMTAAAPADAHASWLSSLFDKKVTIMNPFTSPDDKLDAYKDTKKIQEKAAKHKFESYDQASRDVVDAYDQRQRGVAKHKFESYDQAGRDTFEAYDQRQRGLAEHKFESYDQAGRDTFEAYDQRQRDGIELAEENPEIIGAGAIGPHVVTNPAVGTTVTQMAHASRRDAQHEQRSSQRRNRGSSGCQTFERISC